MGLCSNLFKGDLFEVRSFNNEMKKNMFKSGIILAQKKEANFNSLLKETA